MPGDPAAVRASACSASSGARDAASASATRSVTGAQGTSPAPDMARYSYQPVR